MEVSKGFQIEQPEIFVPWKISEEKLKQLFNGSTLRHVTNGYLAISCTSLSGLAHELGFHFHPRDEGVLIELEFFRKSYPDQAASYQEFERHLEATFGSPTHTTIGSEGFPSHTWQLRGAQVVHFVYDRFGLEEHVRIKKLPSQDIKTRLFSKPFYGWFYKARRSATSVSQLARLGASD